MVDELSGNTAFPLNVFNSNAAVCMFPHITTLGDLLLLVRMLKVVCLVLPCCCLLAPLSPGSSLFFLSIQRVAHHRRRLYGHEYHR